MNPVNYSKNLVMSIPQWLFVRVFAENVIPLERYTTIIGLFSACSDGLANTVIENSDGLW